ncbi:hypothetical protein [Brevibacillus borstelensis]|uniref:hypothetical protein n=1 Tax=Brevibacillus borstelensis TaxID=45462 RepID=UPI0030F75B92
MEYHNVKHPDFDLLVVQSDDGNYEILYGPRIGNQAVCDTRLDGPYEVKETAVAVARSFPDKYDYLKNMGYRFDGHTFYNTANGSEISVTHLTDTDVSLNDFIKWHQSLTAAK